MDNNKSEGIGNVYTVLGGALLGMAIVDQAAKAIAPVVQKLTSGETAEDLRLLPESGEDKPDGKVDKQKHDSSQNEIAELKRKIAEYEEKATGQHQ